MTRDRQRLIDRWRLARAIVAAVLFPPCGGTVLYGALSLAWPGHTWPIYVAGLFAALVLFGFGIEAYDAIRRYQIKYRISRADQRGRELLDRLLTPAQRLQYSKTGTITVPIAGGHQATIGDHIPGVQWRSNKGRAISQCVATIGVDHTDDTIAKLLALRTDPKALARVSWQDERDMPI